jgi:1,4-dihydroxy-2-naphthoate octaprenyltransferase
MKMARINRGKELNLILGETSRNMFLFALLLTIGLLL